ncbi:hypothetical protein AQUCO_01500205v1 [Aquilegia coerulea]|uniref:Cytochrome P450 n=1 Tax=Aquilegia coerulea TaxID=218851 RepID=A0A2G5DST1_AQUCA|nr:hypothetical protein AQUCO_01500205v1 [Aquilegia coerulea]
MEESLFIKLLISLIVLLLLVVVVKTLYSLVWVPKRLDKHIKQQGVKGNSYKFLYGDMKQYVKLMKDAWAKPMNLTHHIAPRVVPFVNNAVQLYGRVSLIWTGKTPRLIILVPELMQEILADKYGHFQKPPVNALILILTRGLASLEGEKWAKHRKIINPAFQMEKLKGMVPAISTSCYELVQHWNTLVGAQGFCEVDIWSEFENLTGDIISRTAFGSSFKEGKRIFQLQKEQATLVIEAMLTFYIPGFRFIPTKKNQRRKHLDKEIKSMLRDLIHRKECVMKTEESSSDDLLSLLLQSNHQTKLEDDVSKGLTIDEVIEECKQFYFAGQETTSSLLTWAMVVLAMHRSWQEKAREEVMRVCGENPPNYESINHLKIVTMVLYEVLRLYPPVVEIYRHTYKATKVSNISLPPGVDLTLPILLIHHDQELWGNDAEDFKPERFAEGVLNASKNNRLAFFPFGWEAKIALATILQHFSFELSPFYTHAPYTVITLQPQHGAQIILHQL